MKLILNCDQSTIFLWYPHHNKALSTSESIGLNLHLLICPKCRIYQKEFHWITQTLKESNHVPDFSIAYKMPEEVKQQINDSIHKNQNASQVT